LPWPGADGRGALHRRRRPHRPRPSAARCKVSPAPLCRLALEDGAVLRGTAFGARGEAAGEVVFNTAMSGYQEVLTDPSYRGQIVAMTAPHIGNVGTNPEDGESERAYLSGFVVRELSPRVSSWRATSTLDAFLEAEGVIGCAGIDTRALT